MSGSRNILAAGAMALGLATASMSNPAQAMPSGLAVHAISAAGTNATEVRVVRHRRVHRRRGGGAEGAAVLGLFGTVLGGVIANQRYNDYSDSSYGRPYEYGYAPGYFSGQGYGGEWRGRGGRGFGGGGRAFGEGRGYDGGHRGFGGGHGGGPFGRHR